MTTRAIDLRCAECDEIHRVLAQSKRLILCKCGNVFAVWNLSIAACGKWVQVPGRRYYWSNPPGCPRQWSRLP